jgi:hypothetical protein
MLMKTETRLVHGLAALLHLAAPQDQQGWGCTCGMSWRQMEYLGWVIPL